MNVENCHDNYCANGATGTLIPMSMSSDVVTQENLF